MQAVRDHKFLSSRLLESRSSEVSSHPPAVSSNFTLIRDKKTCSKGTLCDSTFVKAVVEPKTKQEEVVPIFENYWNCGGL